MSIGRDRNSMIGTLLVLLPISFLPFVSGCKTGTIGRTIDGFEEIVKGEDTKDSVYLRFGVPDDVFPFPGDRTLLVYERKEDIGMSFGGGYGGFPILLIGHSHVGTDSAYVIVDARGIVTDVGIRRQSDLAARRVWPFGK